MDDRYFAIIPSAFVAFLLVFGISLLFGKMTKLLPGYNAKATDENAAFFERIYSRKVGFFVLTLSVLVAGVFCGLIFGIVPLTAACGALGAVYAMGWFIYIKNDTRSRRALYLAKELEKQPDGLSAEEIEKWKNELGTRKKTSRKEG